MKKISTESGITDIIVIRIFDIISISTLFFVSLPFVQVLPQWVGRSTILIGTILLMTMITLLCLIFRGSIFVGAFNRMLKTIGLGNTKFTNFLIKKLYNISISIKRIKSKTSIIKLYLTSFIIWILTYLILFIFIKGMGLSFSFFQMVIALTMLSILNIFPIRGIGGFGTTEGAWTVVLMGFNTSKETAIVVGFSLHIIQLLYVLFFGLIGIVLIRNKLRKN